MSIVLSSDRQISLCIVFDFRFCLCEFAACCVKCSDRPEQLRLPANRVHFIHACDVQSYYIFNQAANVPEEMLDEASRAEHKELGETMELIELELQSSQKKL